MIFKSLYQSKFIYRQFHTSSPRHIHPLIWVFLKPALKGVAWITGRSTRKWYQQLPPEKRSVFAEHLNRHKYKYIGIFGTIGTACAIHYYTHLEASPITGRRRFMMMNAEHLTLMSDMEKEKIAKMFSDQMFPEHSKQTQLVARVARRIIGANMDLDNIRNIKWTARVVDVDIKNAFVLPTGDIYVTRGLLETLINEDQLAIILAHELSHALLGHSAERLSYLQLIDMFGMSIFGAYIIWSIFPRDWISFVVNYIFENFITFTSRLPYSRLLEEEADEVGLMLAAKACFDVREAVALWRIVHEAEMNAELPEFISTHPASAKRAETLNEKLPWALDIRRQCHCSPLPENKPPVSKLNISNNPNEKVMGILAKPIVAVHNIPVINANKKE
ncbi:unnamed protein product [Rotaria sordida]|uniref:Metalloendopeptidase OMA1, mitochondrial n=1 Tax=Rotaria sordida TaxID=392033 RepID=A0A813TKC7_9BILA|nr:unnamed protein product [Rotaria sordida]